MGQSAKFWDRIAKRYSKQSIADEATYQKKLEITREYFRPDMEVLEFGCGTGSTALLHAPYVKHILATDISSRMIEIAQGKADTQNVENITFECAAIDTFSLPDQIMDAVLGLNILHLVENRDEIIAKIHKILKPGGVFVTSTVCIADMMKIFRIVVPVGGFLRLIPLVKVFTTKDLEASLINAGFVIDFQWQPGKNKAVFIVAKKAT
ncbi:MAG: class I SAM-dependent methyltransferase [Maribacter sp.]|nr:class I SAM-dependent methyltransferase [Maribacter sp.]